MADKTPIEWTEATWNPLTGCQKISPGCKNCYAERLSKRLKAMGNNKYKNGFELVFHENALAEPLKKKKPQTVFVNSMSDLFHQDVPLQFIKQVFDVMEQANWHQFQVLTKRSERLSELDQELNWRDNIWLGVSVENEDYKYRIDDLRSTAAHTKFLSIEPLLGPLGPLNLTGIDWVIVGGESGPRSRMMDPTWVLDIRDQCQAQGVPFFFKQWGGTNKKKTGRLLEGQTWNEMPAAKTLFEPAAFSSA